MLPNKDKIKDLFSSKLKDFEADAPMFNWDAMEINADNPSTPTEASPTIPNAPITEVVAAVAKTKVITMAVAATAAAVAACVTLAVIFDPSEEITPIQPQAQVIEVAQSEGEKPKEIQLTASDFAQATPRVYAQATEADIISAKTLKYDKYQKQDNSSNYAEMDWRSMQLQYQEEGEIILSAADEKLLAELQAAEGKMPLLPARKKFNGGSSFGLSLSTNMTMLASNESKKGNGDLLFSYDQRSTNFLKALSSLEETVELEHNQPVSVGLLFEKRLTDQWALESGLVYTHLSSRAKTQEILGIRETQKFDYLGIPINVNYRFANLGHADFYASIGVMFQKDIKGTYTSQIKPTKTTSGETIYNDILKALVVDQSNYFNEAERMKRNIHQSKIQISAQGVLGVTYPLYKFLQIYGNVGVAHYFEANNKYKTIYSDRKTQLDLNLGLKASF